jgi:DNA-binding PadR family transcriptional regulator
MDATIPDGWRGLSATRRDVLVLLVVDGPLTNRELHDTLDTGSRQTVYYALEELEADGLVESDGDGRPATWAVTDDGRELVQRAVVGQANQLRMGQSLRGP